MRPVDSGSSLQLKHRLRLSTAASRTLPPLTPPPALTAPALHWLQVYLHAADRQWVTCPSPRLQFWEGDERQLGPGLRLLRLGGHFPGSCVLLWEAARDGKGVLFTGGWRGRRGLERHGC